MVGLPEGRKGFKIGHRQWQTDTQQRRRSIYRAYYVAGKINSKIPTSASRSGWCPNYVGDFLAQTHVTVKIVYEDPVSSFYPRDA